LLGEKIFSGKPEKSKDSTAKIWCQEKNFHSTNPIQAVGDGDSLQGISLQDLISKGFQ